MLYFKMSEYLSNDTIVLVKYVHVLFQEIVRILPADPLVLEYCSQVSDGKIDRSFFYARHSIILIINALPSSVIC